MIESKRKNGLSSFKDLFREHRFIVPDYQRGYSWEEEHRADLLDDILEVIRSEVGYNHYMGTVVEAINGDETTGEIVDGQQRITSLFILLKEIQRFQRKTDEIPDEDIQFIERITDPQNPALKLNDESHDFFEKSVLRRVNETPENKSQRNIQNAREQFSEWLENHVGEINEILDVVLNRLGFLLYRPDREKEIGIMFEVINNRGKPLSQLEKIKNYLRYYASKRKNNELSSAVDIYWTDILADLSSAGITSNDDEDSFLRYCWLVHQNVNKDESYDVYGELKEQYPVHDADGHSEEYLVHFVNFLRNSARYYDEFFNGDREPLGRLRHHPQYGSIMPLYLAVRHVFSENDWDRQDEEDILNLLEILNFRVYVCPEVTKRWDSHQAPLFRLADRFYWSNSPDAHQFRDIENTLGVEDLKVKLQEFIDEHCGLKDFVRSLTLDRGEEYNYRHWNGLKFFLANYELWLKKEHSTKGKVKLDKLLESPTDRDKGSDAQFSIEHLWASNNRKDQNDREKDEHEKSRLGNMALLERGLNSKAGQKHIEEKLEIYHGDDDEGRSSDLQMIKNLPDIVEEALEYAYDQQETRRANWYWHLYRRINDLREQKMLEYALQRWGLDEETDRTVQVDSEMQKKENDTEIFRIT